MTDQTPSCGHTLHFTQEMINGVSHTHRTHMSSELGRGGQFYQKDVVVEGEGIKPGVFNNLIQDWKFSEHG